MVYIPIQARCKKNLGAGLPWINPSISSILAAISTSVFASTSLLEQSQKDATKSCPPAPVLLLVMAPGPSRPLPVPVLLWQPMELSPYSVKKVNRRCQEYLVSLYQSIHITIHFFSIDMHYQFNMVSCIMILFKSEPSLYSILFSSGRLRACDRYIHRTAACAGSLHAHAKEKK